MVNNPKYLEEKFDGGLKHSLFSNFKRWQDAFLEIVDNAAGQRIPGRKQQIDIYYGKDYLEITDKNSKGMDEAKLQEFLSWGKIKTRTKEDLGAYSAGGKAAMGYLANSFELFTSPVGKEDRYGIEDQNLHDYETKKYKLTAMTGGNKQFGFTKIVLRRLRKNIKGTDIPDLIAKHYRPLIIGEEIEFYYNEARVKLPDLPLEWSVLLYDQKGEDAGYVGNLKQKSGLRGGMRCYKKGRLICEEEYFGHPDPRSKATMNYLFGEVELTDVPVVMNKTDFDRSSLEWQKAQEYLHAQLKPYVDELLGKDITEEASDTEKKRLEEARLIVAEMEKLLSDPVKDETTGTGIKRPERTGETICRPPSVPTGRKNEPRTPPPTDAVTRRRRLGGGFPDCIYRAMDPRIRSIIEQAGEKKTIVVNNKFPAYIVFKGSLDYLIETIAVHMARPEGETITEEQYIRAFDEKVSEYFANIDVAKERITKKLKKKK